MTHRDEFRKYGEDLAEDFEKSLHSARREAGKSFGAEIVQEQRANLRADGSGRRRQAAVRSVIGKDGTLIFLDHAPLARAQEDGGTIKAAGWMLAVGKSGESLGKPGTKIPGAFTMQSKSGATLLVRKKPDGSLENLATLVRSITIRDKLGYRKLIAARFPQYLSEVNRLLFGK